MSNNTDNTNENKGGGYMIKNEKLNEKNKDASTGAIIATGATIGTFVGGPIGAAIGGGIGAVISLFK